ncbi:MAG: protease HtpX [Succinivibrionaceae bacterium]
MRGILYLAVMTGIILVFGIVMQIVVRVIGIDLSSHNFISILIVAAIFGFGGSMVSLFASKFIVKKTMGVQLVTDRRDPQHAWLLDTVKAIADEKGVAMPEVGIYNSSQMNAFATGWNKNAALVCVSTGIMKGMNDEELSAVLGHEMSHVSNGDMVTSCLLQGIMNTFVYALSIFIAQIITSFLRSKSDSRDTGGFFIYHTVQTVLQIIFGLIATVVVMWFSRWREYRADAGAAELYGKKAMISALRALSRTATTPEGDKETRSVATLCIYGGLNAQELFMTHPTIEHRIEALEKLPD